MAYHITTIVNGSAGAVAVTNPTFQNDSHVLAPGETYKPHGPILINAGNITQTYAQALLFAVNFYTIADDFCFWDNRNNYIIGIGVKSTWDITGWYGPAGNIKIIVISGGFLQFFADK